MEPNPEKPANQAMDVVTNSPPKSTDSVDQDPQLAEPPLAEPPVVEEKSEAQEVNSVEPTKQVDKVEPVAAVKKQKQFSPVPAITIAVLLAICLSILAVFSYQSNSDATTGPTSSNGTPPQTANTTSPADVDSLIKALDDSLAEVDDTNDFDSTTINDSTLGL